VAPQILPQVSYAKANRELAAAFERYLIARGRSSLTIRAYKAAVLTLTESLGAASLAVVDRITLRSLLSKLYRKGLHPNTLNLRMAALRSFFKFIRLTGLTKHDPTLLIAHRRLPRQLPRVLSVEEIERLIAAARNPFERAVVEVLYATGVRVSELVNLRLENIDFAEHVILVKRGKGGEDRYVLFGRPASLAMRDYIASRPSRTGFLFEARAHEGRICQQVGHWYARFYVDGAQHEIAIGSVRELRTAKAARREFERIATSFPGYRPKAARPYTARAIGLLVSRLARRAGLGRVHPHALRRAMACHMLASGANIRAIQELLGHERISTTTIYTHLTAQDLKKAHSRFHPHGDAHAEAE